MNNIVVPESVLNNINNNYEQSAGVKKCLRNVVRDRNSLTVGFMYVDVRFFIFYPRQFAYISVFQY